MIFTIIYGRWKMFAVFTALTSRRPGDHHCVVPTDFTEII